MTTEHLTELDHEALRGLLGAWALRACPAQEAAALELHLDGCPECAEEAARLRHAAARFSADTPLDQPDGLRQQVIDFCLARRTAELPLAPWAAPYAAETAKLDALLRDLGPSEWQEVAELPWHGGALSLRPAEVLCHLAAVDGLLAVALGLPDSVPAAGPRVPAQGGEPWSALMDRTGRLIRQQSGRPPEEVRTRWRRQSLAIVRTVEPQSEALVDYGFAELPIQDAFLDRAFECWIHGEDVARAVDYPYTAPAPQHLRQMIDLAVRAVPRCWPAGTRRRMRGPGWEVGRAGF